MLPKNQKEHAMPAIQMPVTLEPSADNYRREAELADSMGKKTAAAEALFHLGRLEETAGRDAAPIFARAYSLDPQSQSIVLNQARCLLRGLKAEEAVSVVQAGVISTPEY